MAAEGVRFDHCYSQPLCTPSRVQLMTGKYNFRNYTRFGYLDPDQKTIGHLIDDAGYATAIAGNWQLNEIYSGEPGHTDGRRPLEASFDDSLLCIRRWRQLPGQTRPP